jgi:hypothetical protein
MSKDLLQKLIVRKFLKFYGTRRFIAVFRELATGPYPEPDNSSSHILMAIV